MRSLFYYRHADALLFGPANAGMFATCFVLGIGWCHIYYNITGTFINLMTGINIVMLIICLVLAMYYLALCNSDASKNEAINAQICCNILIDVSCILPITYTNLNLIVLTFACELCASPLIGGINCMIDLIFMSNLKKNVQ